MKWKNCRRLLQRNPDLDPSLLERMVMTSGLPSMTRDGSEQQRRRVVEFEAKVEFVRIRPLEETVLDQTDGGTEYNGSGEITWTYQILYVTSNGSWKEDRVVRLADPTENTPPGTVRDAIAQLLNEHAQSTSPYKGKLEFTFVLKTTYKFREHGNHITSNMQNLEFYRMPKGFVLPAQIAAAA